MTFENGYITIVQQTPSGGLSFDEDGNPIVPTPALAESEPIPCNWQTANHDKLGVYVDGNFERASFVIMIDLQPFDGKRIRIYDDQSKLVAETNVQDAQRLIYVNAVKILCQ